ncbi:hypothetical protein AB2K85_000552 [Escherichia coli]
MNRETIVFCQNGDVKQYRGKKLIRTLDYREAKRFVEECAWLMHYEGNYRAILEAPRLERTVAQMAIGNPKNCYLARKPKYLQRVSLGSFIAGF